MKRTLLFAAIASVLTTSAFASNIVTSKTYVDNRDNLKVDIAQGVGTNNANVGKTLVVNSSGNLELGTPSAGNYVEDSITDGVTTKAPSEDAVHDALAGKQNTIPAASSDVLDEDYGISKTLVATTDTAGQVEQMGVIAWPKEDYDLEALEISEDDFEIMNSAVPSYATTNIEVASAARGLTHLINNYTQREIPESGKILYEWNHNDISQIVGPLTPNSSTWLESYVKGTGLVTKTNARGIVGERKIIETADVANYGTGTATERQIQEISIPTMGAVMTAISNNTPTLPTGTANTVVMYNNSGAIGGSRGIYDGSTTYNSTNDVSKLATAGVVETKQAKKTCAGWPDGVEHTDANCWLWNMPD